MQAWWLKRSNHFAISTTLRDDPFPGTVKLSSLAAFSPPAATAKSFILSLLSSRILSQNGQILLNLTVPV